MLIYLIDKDLYALHSLEATVRATLPDAEVEAFTDTRALLETFYGRSCDVAMVRVELDGISGLALGRKLTEIKDDVNLIFMSPDGKFAKEAFDLYASAYLTHPCTTKEVATALHKLRYPLRFAKKIFIKTFGNFEVFYRGEPVRFRSPKSQEMLAYLVDREGTLVPRQEMAGVLFGDDYSRSAQVRLSQIAARLEEDLETAGIRHFFYRDNGYFVKLSEAVCDLSEYLKGKSGYPYLGEYMEQFSFGEYRKGILSGRG